MARARRAVTNPGGSSSSKATTTAKQFKCPECGRTFTRAAALGAHRRQAHGVAGTSAASASARRRRNRGPVGGTPSATRRPRQSSTRARSAADDGIDRDALIAAVFPNGLPPKESVIREVARWLDDAEALARLR
jgi:predicted RNA-binding Zn-ribbon protein involved in translation (DUF1610 family)